MIRAEDDVVRIVRLRETEEFGIALEERDDIPPRGEKPTTQRVVVAAFTHPILKPAAKS